MIDVTPNQSVREYELPRPEYLKEGEPHTPLIVRRILRNMIRTPDGTVLESEHVHDYRTHTDKNGRVYMVDGGRDYLRRNRHDDAPYTELSVYVDDDHEINRDNVTWGTYGKNGDEPFHRKKLKDMSNNHIRAVLETQSQVPDWLREILDDELNYRCNHATR